MLLSATHRAKRRGKAGGAEGGSVGHIATGAVSMEFIFHKHKHGCILLLDGKLPFFYVVISVAGFGALI